MSRHMSLRKKILVLNVLPVFLIGLIVIILTFTVIKTALINEVKDSLKGMATAALAAYDQNKGVYLVADNGDVLKGGFNISRNETIVDEIKENTGVEITFFYGSERIMTSAKGADGYRILGSPAGDRIVEKVLKGNQEYFSEAVMIEDTLFYGYYIPVCQYEGEAPIGMIFAGADKSQKDEAISLIINTIIIIVIVMMLVFMVISIIFSTSVSGSIKKSVGVLESVAAGDLNVEVDARLVKKKDEVGALSRAVISLQNELKESLASIKNNSSAVLDASEILDSTAKGTNISIREVESAVTDIAKSASVQADISDTASRNVLKMGEKIQKTSKEMEEMKSGAMAMRDAEEETAQTIVRLLESNVEVKKLIGKISSQTSQTNESARKIKEATEIISSIADETSLLSLNASIEAARAGENGKGFAVVAGQIQRLASQSNESSKRIEDIVHQLIEDSDKAVVTMESVTDTITAQSDNMQQTELMTREVMDKIENSMLSLSVIEESIVYLDESRNEITKTVKELSDIANKNAATTEKVCATVNTVSEDFTKVGKSTEGLKSIAEGLDESIGHFKV